MTQQKPSLQKFRPHWYFITIFYCPICAGSRIYRERRYTPRPDEWEDRHEQIDSWDYCGAL